MTIRRQPADFIVRERLGEAFRATLTPAPTKSTPYAILHLAKTSLATPDAIRFLAQTVGVPIDHVSYAGLKDKHAQTTQHVSIEPGPGNRPVNLPARIEGPNWEAHVIGWAPEHLTASAIDGNSFELVVRDLTRAQSDEMGRRADMLWTEARESPPPSHVSDAPERGEASVGGVEESTASDRSPASVPSHPDLRKASGPASTDALHAPQSAPGLLIVNYFGDQRFGIARHHQGWAGRALIDGDFELALRLAIGTPARKDSGRTRTITRLCAQHWGDWKALARDLPRCPERRPFERLAAGGDFKQAFAAVPTFTQQMAVESYQSLLWNRAAALISARLGSEPSPGGGRPVNPGSAHAKPQPPARGSDQRRQSTRPAPGDLLHTEDPFGDLVFPVPGRVDAEWRATILPLLGRKTPLDPRWAWAVEQVLKDEALTQNDLRIPGLHRPFYGEAPRRLFIVAERFEMSRAERDDLPAEGRSEARGMRWLSFDLPRGAYATVVLRALGQ